MSSDRDDTIRRQDRERRAGVHRAEDPDRLLGLGTDQTLDAAAAEGADTAFGDTVLGTEPDASRPGQTTTGSQPAAPTTPDATPAGAATDRTIPAATPGALSDSHPFDETALASDAGAAGSTDHRSGETHRQDHRRPSGTVRRGAGPYPPGSKIGRFTVVDHLGEGGMGVVLTAYDPDLDRRVAIKMLRNRTGSNLRARLEREARAMAKLSHPNVVAVHDVGTREGQLFIAMEFVDGETLADWLERDERSWREVIAVFLDAGAGLAAAHEAGMVHRDFKPQNVLVGKDGRIRVSDFGLVSDTGEAVPPDGNRPDVAAVATTDTPSLTQTGAIMGTPRYMAPEQHAGLPADAKADQFSFCVALWEALYGSGPFGTDSYQELVSNVLTGTILPPATPGRAPAWLKNTILRGLATDPKQRFPSMEELLAALRHDPRARLRLVAGGAGVATLVASAVLATLYFGPEADGAALCDGGERQLDGVWDTEVKSDLQLAFSRVAGASAANAFDGISAALDRYRDQWLETHSGACRATHVDGTQSAELLDLRMGCLDRRLAEMRALTRLLIEKASADVIQNARQAVHDLGAIDACNDEAELRERIPLPSNPATKKRIGELRDRVSEAEALERLGDYKAALAVIEEVAAEAEEIGYAPLNAEYSLRRAGLLHRTGDYDQAEAAYRASANAASEAHDDARIARSWIDLMYVLYEQGRLKEALALEPVAAAAVVRVDRSARLLARFHNNVGTVHLGLGQYREAHEAYGKALEIQTEQIGEEDNPELPAALMNYATSLWYTGQLKEARSHFERAHELLVADLGAEHPTVAFALRNIGDLDLTERNYEPAIARYREAAKIWESAHGPNHPSLAHALQQLCYALGATGELEEALAAGNRAVEIRVNHFGEQHPQVAEALRIVASVHRSAGDLDGAAEQFRRALAIHEATVGADNVQLAWTLDQLADIAEARSELDVALEHRVRSATLREKNLGAHNDTGYAYYRLGRLYYSREQYEESGAAFEKAQTIWTSTSGDGDADVNRSRFGRSQALFANGQREQAVALLEEVVRYAEQSSVAPEERAQYITSFTSALWQTGKRGDARKIAEQAAAALPDGPAREHLDAWLKAPR